MSHTGRHNKPRDLPLFLGVFLTRSSYQSPRSQPSSEDGPSPACPRHLLQPSPRNLPHTVQLPAPHPGCHRLCALGHKLRQAGSRAHLSPTFSPTRSSLTQGCTERGSVRLAGTLAEFFLPFPVGPSKRSSASLPAPTYCALLSWPHSTYCHLDSSMNNYTRLFISHT